MKYFLVPLILFLSSLMMSLAWLGHLKFKNHSLWILVLASWLIVLPEYVLNVLAIRYGHGTFSGAAMATFNLCTGVVCVALVSAFYLKESLKTHQLVGFALLTVAMVLVAWDPGREEAHARKQAEEKARVEAIDEAPSALPPESSLTTSDTAH